MIIKDLLHEKNLLELILDHHLEELYARDNPQGILLCQKHRNTFRWQHKYLLNGRAITVNLNKTEALMAQKLAVNLYRMVCIEFLQEQITSIDNLIRSLRSELSSETQPKASPVDLLTTSKMHLLLQRIQHCPRVPADFFRAQSPYNTFIISHLEKEYAGIIDWYLGDFKQNKDHPEALQFQVKLGFKVRSKSEVMEADKLFEAGILFHYEELVLLSDEESYPDFFIPITIFEKYAWEHHGAMDKQSYFNRTRGKILNYLDHQWFPGINMITTYETRRHPLTEELVDNKIRWLKGRYRRAFPDLPPDESFNLYDLAAIVKYHRSGQ